MFDVETWIFRIGRSRHSQIVELAPCRPNFTYPSSIIMLVMPYGVESKGLLPVLETTLKAGRRSCSLRFTPASRDHAKRFRESFVRAIGTLYTFHSLLLTGIYASAVSPTTSVVNGSETIHFGRQWRVNAKTQKIHGRGNFNDRCNAWQLSLVIVIANATDVARCCKNVS